MPGPRKKGRDARVDIKVKQEHKDQWTGLVDDDRGENFTDWMIDAANERAMRLSERREPGKWATLGIVIVRPSGPVVKTPPPADGAAAAPRLPSPSKGKPSRRR